MASRLARILAMVLKVEQVIQDRPSGRQDVHFSLIARSTAG